jgi:hypothetical protein
MENEKIPEFNNLLEQKIYALQKVDELLAEIDRVKAAFDTPEEIQRLTDVFNKAKAATATVSLEEFVGSSTKDKVNATNEYKFLYDVAAFESIEDYIADLKEKADTQKNMFLMLRQTLENTAV